MVSRTTPIDTAYTLEAGWLEEESKGGKSSGPMPEIACPDARRSVLLL